jgi:hypothetical protein
MSIIKTIVLHALEMYGQNDDGTVTLDAEERDDLSQQAEEVVTTALLQQFTLLLGGTLDYDSDGQAVIYTGLCNPQLADETWDSEERFDGDDEVEDDN